MATNVKIIRFLNEEIIGEILYETDTSLTVRNPLRVVVMPSKSDPKNPTVGFAPYCEWTNDKDFVITKNFLVYTAEPLPVFLNQYNAQFGGIHIPESTLIVP